MRWCVAIWGDVRRYEPISASSRLKTGDWQSSWTTSAGSGFRGVFCFLPDLSGSDGSADGVAAASPVPANPGCWSAEDWFSSTEQGEDSCSTTAMSGIGKPNCSSISEKSNEKHQKFWKWNRMKKIKNSSRIGQQNQTEGKRGDWELENGKMVEMFFRVFTVGCFALLVDASGHVQELRRSRDGILKARHSGEHNHLLQCGWHIRCTVSASVRSENFWRIRAVCRSLGRQRGKSSIFYFTLSIDGLTTRATRVIPHHQKSWKTGNNQSINQSTNQSINGRSIDQSIDQSNAESIR